MRYNMRYIIAHLRYIIAHNNNNNYKVYYIIYTIYNIYNSVVLALFTNIGRDTISSGYNK